MYHTFNIEVAKKVGVNAAIILNNIYWWIEKNKANNKHFYDGYYWTYNARKAYVELFPYFTERQIEYALKNLIDNGYVITGNYNKSAYDRTLWYAITKKGYSILQNCEMEVTKTVNENNKNVKPIPDINTNINDNRYKHNPISNDIGGKARKKSYKDIFDDSKYTNIKDALQKHLGRGI